MSGPAIVPCPGGCGAGFEDPEGCNWDRGVVGTACDRCGAEYDIRREGAAYVTDMTKPPDEQASGWAAWVGDP